MALEATHFFFAFAAVLGLRALRMALPEPMPILRVRFLPELGP